MKKLPKFQTALFSLEIKENDQVPGIFALVLGDERTGEFTSTGYGDDYIAAEIDFYMELERYMKELADPSLIEKRLQEIDEDLKRTILMAA